MYSKGVFNAELNLKSSDIIAAYFINCNVKLLLKRREQQGLLEYYEEVFLQLFFNGNYYPVRLNFNDLCKARPNLSTENHLSVIIRPTDIMVEINELVIHDHKISLKGNIDFKRNKAESFEMNKIILIFRKYQLNKKEIV